jgi:hypothetical protein
MRKATRGRKVRSKPKLKQVDTPLGPIWVKDGKSQEQYIVHPDGKQDPSRPKKK